MLSSEMKKEHLRDFRKETMFYCPQCGNAVNLKVGDIVIPHFAHKKDASCSASFSEGESSEHLLGKQQLYDFFKKNTEGVKLEPYFKSLAQRPDLLVKINAELVPIEFQCSTIPISQIESRTKGYLSAKMTPIWILYTPAKLKTLPQGVGAINLSRFEAHFITHSIAEGFVFLTYYPQNEQFHYFSNLLHIAGKQYIGVHRTLPISKQIFPFARPKIPSDSDLQRYTWIYLSQRKKYLNSRVLLNRKGINDPFLRKCYELRILPLELPLWIGVPVTAINPFPMHSSEWQLGLIYFMKKRGLQFNTLSVWTIRNFVQSFGDGSKNQVDACKKYRDFLLSIGVNSLNNETKFGEKQLVKAIALTFLAN